MSNYCDHCLSHETCRNIGCNWSPEEALIERLREENARLREVLRLWAAADFEIEEAVRQTARAVAREKRDALLAERERGDE